MPSSKDSSTRHDTNSADTKWILTQCELLVKIAKYCRENNVSEGKALIIANSKIPRMSSGKGNTCETLCAGILDNFKKGQYNFTDKQTMGLEIAFKVGAEVIENFEEVEFEEVDVLPKISLPRENVLGMEAKNTLSDLFDVEAITVTYKRRGG